MKNRTKKIGVLMAALVFIGIYSCKNCPKFDGTTINVGKTTFLIPKSYKMVKHDSTGMMFVESPDSTTIAPPPPPPISLTPPQNIAQSTDTITINPGGKGGK